MCAAATSARSPRRACARHCPSRSSSSQVRAARCASAPKRMSTRPSSWRCRNDVVLVAFGDMLRVPVNVPRSEPRSLEQAKAAGADIRPIASPLEAVRIAQRNPIGTVVFFAAGFETTTAPVRRDARRKARPTTCSCCCRDDGPGPRCAMLLESGTPRFDALVAPGHVATVMGPEEWEFVAATARHAGRDRRIPSRYAAARRPTPCCGSTFRGEAVPRQLLPRSRAAGRQRRRREASSTRRWTWSMPTGAASASSRSPATRCSRSVRGARCPPRAALLSRPERASASAKCRPAATAPTSCSGRIRPNECRLYGVACTPRNPIGPCMVSDEGACRIWWASGLRENQLGGPRVTSARCACVSPATCAAGAAASVRPRAGRGFSTVRLSPRAPAGHLGFSAATARARSRSSRKEPAREFESFAADLVARAPPLAQPRIVTRESILRDEACAAS